MEFYKGHGLGNDYIALELDGVEPTLTPPAIRLLCDRHVGVGSDGVLGRTASTHAEFGLRIFNPDGSEAEKSGNGLRIFAAYLLRRGEVVPEREFTVETPGGVVRMTVHGENAAGVLDVEVEMGRASFRSADVGLSGPDRLIEDEPLELAAGDRVHVNTVSIGNPHAVVFVDSLDPEDLRRRAPQIAEHPAFERGTNVQFVHAGGGAVVDALVWERGAGETSASGSSACAVAAAAVRRGLASTRQVSVRMPGGTLDVQVRDDYTILLRGPVEDVFRGRLTDGMLARLRSVSWP